MQIIGTYPTTITNGSPEDATVVMSLFAWVQSQVNGNGCPATAGTAVLKGDGAGGTTTAIPGIDYAPVGAGVPVGAIVDYAGGVVPAGYLWCDGTAVSRVLYSQLFTAIGTTWGVGDGVNTFNLPDFRGRTAVGYGPGVGLTNRNVGFGFGEEFHTLTLAELPSHFHSITDPGHAHASLWKSGTSNAVAGASEVNSVTNTSAPTTNVVTGITATNTSGGGSSHNVSQPSLCTNKIIFIGFGVGGGSGGVVSSVSVASANGFAGTVANPTSTPAITLTTTVTGVLKGNGTSISAATGADFPAMTNVAGGAVPTPPNDATKYLGGTGTFSDPLIITGTGRRITANMSDGTLANRLAFQSSVVNGNSILHLLPNGTATISSISLETDAAITTGQVGQMTIGASGLIINSNVRGAGVQGNMVFQIGGGPAATIAADKSMVFATTYGTTPVAVGSLPTGVLGAHAMVNNALGPVFGAAVVAGGAVTVPVFYNGANWTVG